MVDNPKVAFFDLEGQSVYDQIKSLLTVLPQKYQNTACSQLILNGKTIAAVGHNREYDNISRYIWKTTNPYIPIPRTTNVITSICGTRNCCTPSHIHLMSRAQFNKRNNGWH